MYVFELIGEHDAFAACEAASVATDVRVVAPGVALGSDVRAHVAHLGWTRSVSRLLARSRPDVAAMQAAVGEAIPDPVEAVAVRARGVRDTTIDTPAIERALGDALVDQGCTIELEEPDAVLRVLVSDESAFLGWVAHEPGGDVGARRPTDRPFFQPGSMSPRLARWIVNVAGARPDTTVLDPMCGTGGIALEAVRVGADAIGVDVQAHMVRGTRRNRRAIEAAGRLDLLRGDARRLPLGPGTVDAVAFDVPYGRQSRIEGASVAADALAEGRRVASRGVVVADRPIAPLAREAGWTVVATFERRVHRSLTRHVAVLAI